MRTRALLWCGVALVAAGSACASDALAASARGFAIARAFNNSGFNSNQQQPGGGPLGSSMYSGGPPVGAGGGVAPAPPGFWSMNSPLSGALQPPPPYTPMTSVTLTPSGGVAVPNIQYDPSLVNPLREMASALKGQDTGTPGYLQEALTSLAPPNPSAYRTAMVKGETAMSRGDYPQALSSFQTARDLSKDSAESLLSLAQTYFAMGGQSYDPAAECLAKALKQFHDLPLVRVCPKGFFGDANDYAKAVAGLERFVKESPKNAGASFLLSYVQFRDRVLDKALTSLEAAQASSPSQDIASGILTLLDGINRAKQMILGEAPQLEKPVDYPWAGIRLAMPKGFQATPLGSFNQVVTGTVEGSGNDPGYPVTLYAYPVSQSGMTLKAFMDFMTGAMREWSFVKDMSTDCEAEVPFQTGKAMVRLIAYTNTANESNSLMGWVAFIREPKDGKGPRIAYILGLAMNEKQADRLVPALAAIAKSMELTDAASPAPGGVAMQGALYEDPRLQFSISLPSGWAGNPTDRGYEMGQMDFARGAVSPKVEVVAQTIPGTFTAKSFGEEAVQRKLPKGVTRKVLSQGAAKLAGRDGYQFVVSQTPDEEAAGRPAVLVGRLILLDKPDGAKAMYAIVVECLDAQAKDVEALAEKVASGFSILQGRTAALAK
jgi:tetratricopeptide (TPR) repeat protein